MKGIRYTAGFKAEATKLMETLDRINPKHTKGTVKLASEGLDKAWLMRRGTNSPNYTGSWNELPRVK